MAKSPIALIIGAGPGVGLSCARAFTSQGYRVIVSSRQARSSGELLKYTHIPGDLANPLSVIELFKEVKEKAGVPSVVIFNGTQLKP